MSKIRDAIETMEQIQANNERLAEASRRLEQFESDVRALRQSHTDLLAVAKDGIKIAVAYRAVIRRLLPDEVGPEVDTWLADARAAIEKAEPCA